MKRQEKRQDKAARKDQRKQEKLSGVARDAGDEVLSGETFPDLADSGADPGEDEPERGD